MKNYLILMIVFLVWNCANQEELQNIKKNINQIANNLKDQTERLIELKNKQQEVLKSSFKY